MIITKSLKLITYGFQYDPDKFIPIKNCQGRRKPLGGLWASLINSRYSWKAWCKEENYCYPKTFQTNFKFQYSGKFLVIRNADDLLDIKWYHLENYKNIYYPDFEELANRGIDAIHLTIDGQWETRLSFPYDLYGWDCESVLVMNPDHIQIYS